MDSTNVIDDLDRSLELNQGNPTGRPLRFPSWTITQFYANRAAPQYGQSRSSWAGVGSSSNSALHGGQDLAAPSTVH